MGSKAVHHFPNVFVIRRDQLNNSLFFLYKEVVHCLKRIQGPTLKLYELHVPQNRLFQILKVWGVRSRGLLSLEP